LVLSDSKERKRERENLVEVMMCNLDCKGKLLEKRRNAPEESLPWMLTLSGGFSLFDGLSDSGGEKMNWTPLERCMTGLLGGVCKQCFFIWMMSVFEDCWLAGSTSNATLECQFYASKNT